MHIIVLLRIYLSRTACLPTTRLWQRDAPINTQTTALLLVAWGFVVANETLGSGDADGIRFPVLPARDISRQAMVQLGRVFLVAYPDYSMSREYNAFFAEEQRSRAEMGARL